MRRRARRGGTEVELNMASMLEHGLQQLLTFFILTFRPPPAEAQIKLLMPPASPIDHVPPGKTPDKPLAGFNLVVITLMSTPDGKLSQIWIKDQPDSPAVDEIPVDRELTGFDQALRRRFSADTAFDQVEFQVGSNLEYSELMRVIDRCTHQSIGGDPNKKLTKLSFTDLHDS